MKLFLDTANVAAVKKWAQTGVVDGVTTNPTHLSKEGSDPVAVVKELCSLLPQGDINVEVTEKDPEAVYQQAKKIQQLGKNVVVKIPFHEDYLSAIKKLVKEGVQINITLIFTVLQSLLMAKLGVKYISPFIGRWDDVDVDGALLIAELRQMITQYGFAQTEILAASIRSVRNYHDVVMAGADVVTLPIAVFEKSLTHPLTERGIKKFDDDWQKLGIKQFP